MIALFKQKNPGNILLLLLFGVLIKLPLFSGKTTIQSADGQAAYNLLAGWLRAAGGTLPLLPALLVFLLLFTQALQLNALLSRYRMMSRPNYLPGMAYLLLSSLFPEWNHFSAPLLVNTVLLLLLPAMFRIYAMPSARGIIFNIGLGAGLASFLFFPAFLLLFWCILAIAIMRPFRLVEWLLCVLGALTPYYFYGAWLFLSDQWSLERLLPSLSLTLPDLEPNLWLAGTAFFILMPFLLGSYYIQENLRKMLIQVRKSWSLLLLLLLICLLLPFLHARHAWESWLIALVPLASFHGSGYLYATYRIIPNLLFWLSAGFILLYQYAGPGW